MKLDRNANGEGKYFLVNMRKLRAASQDAQHDMAQALDVLTSYGALERGDVGDANEFFVVKLKDYYAPGALLGYAARAWTDDKEYAEQVNELAARSGANHPNCKKPD